MPSPIVRGKQRKIPTTIGERRSERRREEISSRKLETGKELQFINSLACYVALVLPSEPFLEGIRRKNFEKVKR